LLNKLAVKLLCIVKTSVPAFTQIGIKCVQATAAFATLDDGILISID
jgi:hypothetical protein